MKISVGIAILFLLSACAQQQALEPEYDLLPLNGEWAVIDNYSQITKTLSISGNTWTMMIADSYNDQIDTSFQFTNTFIYHDGVVLLASDDDLLRLIAEQQAQITMSNINWAVENDPEWLGYMYHQFGTYTPTFEQLFDFMLIYLGEQMSYLPAMYAIYCADTDTLTLQYSSDVEHIVLNRIG